MISMSVKLMALIFVWSNNELLSNSSEMFKLLVWKSDSLMNKLFSSCEASPDFMSSFNASLVSTVDISRAFSTLFF
jgi:Ca2+/Na+ antiporter